MHISGDQPFGLWETLLAAAGTSASFVGYVMIENNPYSPSLSHYPSNPESVSCKEAGRIVYLPAVLMIAQGLIVIGFVVFEIGKKVCEGGMQTIAYTEFAEHLLLILASLLAICGIKLKRIESRRMSYIGAALSLVLWYPLGWLACIWTLMALNRPEVREAIKIRNLTR